MAKAPITIQLNENEAAIVVQGMDLLIASAKRSQNTDKRPAFKELNAKWESELQQVKAKLT